MIKPSANPQIFKGPHVRQSLNQRTSFMNKASYPFIYFNVNQSLVKMELMKPFPPYKTRIMNLLFEGEPTNSKDAYDHCKFHMNEGHPSRASVINFLNLLEKSQYLKSEKESCKGGSRKIYSMAISREEALLKLSSDLNAELITKILKGFN